MLEVSLVDNNEREFLLETESSADDDEIEKSRCLFDVDDINDCADETGNEARRKLICATVLCVIFMVVELIGGYIAGSLAIMVDAAHLITDSLTFILGAFAIELSKKASTSKFTFGFKRIEVLCAVLSIIGIWILTIFILYFAIQRLFHLSEYEIDTNTMLAVSIMGILVNIVMAWILHGGFSCHSGHHNHSHSVGSTSDHKAAKDFLIEDESDKKTAMPKSRCKSTEPNINVQAAFLHVLGDFIQSIGIVVAAIIIKIIPSAKVVDPLCTFLFSLIVICTTVKIFRNATEILLEAVPSHISRDDVHSDLKHISGVLSIHKLNIWSLSSDFHVLVAHLKISDTQNRTQVLSEATNKCKIHGIHDITIQIEDVSINLKS